MMCGYLRINGYFYTRMFNLTSNLPWRHCLVRKEFPILRTRGPLDPCIFFSLHCRARRRKSSPRNPPCCMRVFWTAHQIFLPRLRCWGDNGFEVFQAPKERTLMRQFFEGWFPCCRRGLCNLGCCAPPGFVAWSYKLDVSSRGYKWMGTRWQHLVQEPIEPNERVFWWMMQLS